MLQVQFFYNYLKKINKNRNANAVANCRWDVQRIREQRQVERLKQREMASARRGSGGSTGRHGDGEEPLNSLWPQLDDAEYLEVTESVPVAAFGLPITKFAARYVKKYYLLEFTKLIFASWFASHLVCFMCHCRDTYREPLMVLTSVYMERS